jgi:hypothetical protein
LKRDFEVLERNLARLMRLWEPVVAREEFRARIEREFVAAVARRRMRAVPSERRSVFASPLLRVAAAAALLLVSFVAWNRLARGPEVVVATVESILEGGAVATRDVRDGAWRSHAAGVEAPPLDFRGDFLEIRTPAEAPARVAAAAAEPWSVFPASHLTLERGSEGPVAELLGGGLVASGPAQVRTAQGVLRVLSGGARVAHERPEDERLRALAPQAREWIHVSARAGSLELRGRERGALALERVAEAWLADGAALLAPPEGSDEPDRTELGGEPPERPVAEPLHGLWGHVSFVGAPVERFRVVALQQVNLPQRAEPQPFDSADSAGKFALPSLLPGTYRLFVVAEGFAVAQSDLVVVAPGAAQRVDFELERGGTVSGSVLDAETGAPISGAYLVSESDTQIAVLSLDAPDNLGFDRATTGLGNGNFRFERLSSGDQILRASAPGYGAAWVDVLALADGEERGDVVFRLPRTGRIEGSVLDAAGLPIPEVMVIASTTDFERKRPCLTYRRAIGDVEGRFVLPDLGAGAWAVLNFGPVASLRDGRYTPEFALAGVRVGEVTIVNYHARRPKQLLRGTVRDAQGGPVAALGLMLAPKGGGDPSSGNGWSSATTLADGSYRIPDVEPGAYDLFVAWGGPTEMVYVESFEVLGRGDALHDVALPGGEVRGRVLDGAHGRGMELAVVVLYSFEPDGTRRFAGKVLTDAEGRYVLRPLRDGRHELWAYSGTEAYGPESSALQVAQGVVQGGTEFTLFPGGTLLVEVSADGKGFAGAEVRFLDDRGVEAQFAERTTTDALGTYLVVGIKPGRWRVRARDAAGREREAEVEVVAGARATLELDLGAR